MVKTEYVMLNGVKYADVSGYARDLPPKRREKIERLRFEKDKLLSLTAGMLIRNRIGNTPLSENEHGKPYADGGQFFSVSHSGECVVIAVDDREIGIDVERLPDRDYLQIAERFYHPNELAYVRRAEDSARAFTYVWTRKEAYLKQIGIGIATDLGAVTEQVRAGLTGCDIAMLESNYDSSMLACSAYPYYLKRRIQSGRGHLDNLDCAEELVKLIKQGTKRFVLCHLSKENNIPELALQTVYGRMAQEGISAGDFELCAARRSEPTPQLIL